MIGSELVMEKSQLKVFKLRWIHFYFFYSNVFLVDVSSLTPQITKIDRINTWLTCKYYCPSANGSNNIKRPPGEDLKFKVFLKRDASLDPPYTVQQMQDQNFEIHYVVEGPCA